MPLMLPDTDRMVWLDNSGLELLDSRIGEFSVLSLGTGDTFIDMDALEGMRWVPAHVTLGYWTVMKSGYASCIPPAREVHGTIPLQLDLRPGSLERNHLGPRSCGWTMPTRVL